MLVMFLLVVIFFILYLKGKSMINALKPNFKSDTFILIVSSLLVGMIFVGALAGIVAGLMASGLLFAILVFIKNASSEDEHE